MEIRVKITPKVKKESIELLADGRYHVSVKADRKEGNANARMRALLATHFGVPEGSVHLIAGHSSPTKTVRISSLP